MSKTLILKNVLMDLVIVFLESETDKYIHEITEFVPKDDNIKVYLMKLKNKQKKNVITNIEFWINPTFGNFEEKLLVTFYLNI